MKTHLIIAFGLILSTVTGVWAEPTVKVGSPAPTLHVKQWVQGDAIDNFEKGTVYVVECWATWCGPCVRAILHVSKLNTKYKASGKKVVFIGLNVWERDTSKVAPFLKKMGDKMNYNVALDDGSKSADAWMKASGSRVIPRAFIVNGEGKIAWIGHPASMDKPLEQVVAGTPVAAAKIKPAPKRPKPSQPKVTFKVGDTAPQLSISKWVKGDKIEEFKKGTIYVVECWATWCGPCVVAIPHVSEMNTHYKKENKKVVFIGLNIWERDTSKVEPFVKKMGDKMNYNVAMDDGRQSATAWMTASGSRGIPTAFIIDRDSKLAWKGHPMKMDHILEQVVAGSFDPQEEVARQAKVEKLRNKLGAAYRAKNWEEVIKCIDKTCSIDPSSAKSMGIMKASVLLTEKKDYAAGYALVKELANGPCKKDAFGLMRLSSTILKNKNVEKRDIDLGFELAKQAYEVDSKSYFVIGNLADAYAAKSNYAKAVELQTKAVEKAHPGRAKTMMQKKLDEYKAKAAI